MRLPPLSAASEDVSRLIGLPALPTATLSDVKAVPAVLPFFAAGSTEFVSALAVAMSGTVWVKEVVSADTSAALLHKEPARSETQFMLMETSLHASQAVSVWGCNRSWTMCCSDQLGLQLRSGR